jgi:hypothetical protein
VPRISTTERYLSVRLLHAPRPWSRRVPASGCVVAVALATVKLHRVETRTYEPLDPPCHQTRVPIGAPGARYAATFGRLHTTS